MWNIHMENWSWYNCHTNSVYDMCLQFNDAVNNLGCVVSNDQMIVMKRMWKEVIMDKYYPGICLDVLGKIMKNMGRDSRRPNRDSKRARPE
jgi:hypothetical protein